MPEPSPALVRLAERLHVDAAQVSHLDEAAVERLDELVARAQARDEQAIEEALQETLRFLPRILRGRAKKLLFPEDPS